MQPIRSIMPGLWLSCLTRQTSWKTSFSTHEFAQTLYIPNPLGPPIALLNGISAVSIPHNLQTFAPPLTVERRLTVMRTYFSTLWIAVRHLTPRHHSSPFTSADTHLQYYYCMIMRSHSRGKSSYSGKDPGDHGLSFSSLQTDISPSWATSRRLLRLFGLQNI